MATQIQLPIAVKPKPRFLQRWAYWIIGGVVVIGFANAGCPGLLGTMIRFKQIT